MSEKLDFRIMLKFYFTYIDMLDVPFKLNSLGMKTNRICL